MSTRAIIAYSHGDGRWKGVWNHWSSHTQHLGAEIIRRVGLLDGDLSQFCRQWVDRCPEGWSDFAQGVRTAEGGIWSGTYRQGKVTFERGEWPDNPSLDTAQLPDAHYLYLLDLPARGLLVFEVARGECSAFTQCVFDEAGAANPAQLTPVSE